MTGGEPDRSQVELAHWARELGVEPAVMQQLVEQRRGLVYDIADDPRAWGFDLLASSSERRDAAAAFRQQTRLTGRLAESFLQDHPPLLALVPDPPTMPDGTPLDAYLAERAAIEPEVARAVATRIRVELQGSLGQPLEREAVEGAVRDACWDHDLDATRTIGLVVDALADVL